MSKIIGQNTSLNYIEQPGRQVSKFILSQSVGVSSGSGGGLTSSFNDDRYILTSSLPNSISASVVSVGDSRYILTSSSTEQRVQSAIVLSGAVTVGEKITSKSNLILSSSADSLIVVSSSMIIEKGNNNRVALHISGGASEAAMSVQSQYAQTVRFIGDSATPSVPFTFADEARRGFRFYDSNNGDSYLIMSGSQIKMSGATGMSGNLYVSGSIVANGDGLSLNTPSGSSGMFNIKKQGVESSQNIRLTINHAANGRDFKFYTYNGSTFRDVIDLNHASHYIAIGAVTGSTDKIPIFIDGINKRVGINRLNTADISLVVSGSVAIGTTTWFSSDSGWAGGLACQGPILANGANTIQGAVTARRNDSSTTVPIYSGYQASSGDAFIRLTTGVDPNDRIWNFGIDAQEASSPNECFRISTAVSTATSHGTSPILTLTTGSRAGINVVTPTVTLQVGGDAVVSGSLALSGGILLNGANKGDKIAAKGNDLILSSSTSTVVVSGSFVVKEFIENPHAAEYRIASFFGSNGGQFAIDDFGGGASNVIQLNNTLASGNLHIGRSMVGGGVVHIGPSSVITGLVVPMTGNLYAGNVGIGTTAPETKTHIFHNGGNGSAGVTDYGALVQASGSGGTIQNTLGIESVGDLYTNINLMSNYQDSRKGWHISKRKEGDGNCLQFYSLFSASSGYSFTGPILTMSSSRDVHINNGSVTEYGVVGRNFLTVKGETQCGGIELKTAQADAHDVTIGIMQFTDINSTSTYKRRGLIRGILSGTTANKRGCKISVGTADDNSDVINEVAYFSKGFVVGSPTGGDHGFGTINATAVYDDNTLLTCYVPEFVLSGSIDLEKWDNAVAEKRFLHLPARRFAENAAEELEPSRYSEKWMKNGHLPALPSREEWQKSGNKMNMGKIIQGLWETAEVQAEHIRRLTTRLEEIAPNKDKK